MFRYVIAIVCTAAAGGARADEIVTIYLDDYGIPHIYAETAEGGLYAQGWAMARDRLDQTLSNYLRGMGRYAEAFGPGDGDENVRADLESLMWDHYGVSKRRYHELPEAFRRHNNAFVAGINRWMGDHPQTVPAWWPDMPVDEYMPVAFSRQFIWGWPAGQAAGDLRAIGLRPSYDVDYRSSNEIAIAPGRTSFGAAALIIDPHLSWFGRQRYWECRIHAGDVNISGFATAGFPYVNLGHNDRVAWAHTTGGPDTADVFELALNPDNLLEYRFDDGWRTLTTREVEVLVKGEAEPRVVTFYDSHFGPIVAREGDKAYAAALAYANEIGYLESKYLFMIAKNYKDVITALEVRQIMPQNVMVADVEGNIYYQRTGRVPIRPEGYDYSRPVDGSTSATAWQGIHSTSDLVQVLNPPQGYMQNCNITPDVMMVDSPMQQGLYRNYIFNQPAMYTHQRASRAVSVLHGTPQFTIAGFKGLALDRHCYQYERWVAALERAVANATLSADAKAALEKIRGWDGFSTRDSNGALVYYYWRHALAGALEDDALEALIDKVNNYLVLWGAPESTERITAVENGALVRALEQGAAKMMVVHGDLDAVFGDVFRAGRLDYDGDAVSWPVGGGSLRDEGMATLRAIGFTEARDDGTRWGQSGQTSTQVVILSDPIQSWTQPPIGQSDIVGSPHFRDQAEQLLSEARLKPSWWNEDTLRDGHVRETLTLDVKL